MLPSRTSLPVDGRPKTQQGPQMPAVKPKSQTRLDKAAEGTRGTSTITPKAAAAATASDARVQGF